MDITVREISQRLSQDSERICAMLLPGGKMLKGEWLCGDIHGAPGDSLKVHLQGPHAGEWRDWANDSDHGDLIDLWRIVRGISLPEAVKGAKEWMGIADSAHQAAPRKYSPAPSRADLTKLQPKGKTTAYLISERQLTQDTLDAYMIERHEATIVFPCYSPDGTLINRSYRTLGGEKKVWQDKGCAPCLFGWQAVPESAYGSRTILLCEGQIDCMTWHQWGVAALSIPNGSGQTWIDYEWDNIAAFDHIYISFDMDGAGIENAEKAISRLGKHRCLVVKLPKKDANDCLRAGHSEDEAKAWVSDARPPAMKGLLRAIDLERRLLLALSPQKSCFTLPFFNLQNGDGFFLRPAEVTVWTGVTSHGKSTFLNYLIMMILSTGVPVFLASMECKAEVSLRKMMSSFFNKKPEPSDATEFLDAIGHILIFADVVGYIGQAELMDMMMFSHRRYGAMHFIVDSLMRVEGLEEDYVAQGNFLNRLQEFAKSTGVHVHLVAHPRKLAEDGKPGKMDVKGSSLIPNNADNIVSVCRNLDKDRLRKEGTLTPQQAVTMYDTEIRIEKQRETGWEGRFLLRFDPISFAYSAYLPPATTPAK